MITVVMTTVNVLVVDTGASITGTGAEREAGDKDSLHRLVPVTNVVSDQLAK